MVKKKRAVRRAKPKRGSNPTISIGGDVGGPLVVGNENVVIDTVGVGSTVVVGSNSQVFNTRQETTLERSLTRDEIAELAHLFRTLAGQIEQDVPSPVKAEAQKQAEQIKQAVTGDKPDVAAMARIKTWFAQNLPTILGVVTGVFTNPIVGKLVQAAGEFTLDQYRERLGLPKKS